MGGGERERIARRALSRMGRDGADVCVLPRECPSHGPEDAREQGGQVCEGDAGNESADTVPDMAALNRIPRGRC